MPPSKGTGHPLRLLGVYAVLLAVIYALVFFTGDKSPEPKLGIDLQGGTQVTLTPRTPDGGKPSKDSLKQAQQIIESRVNGLGVAGSEVVIDGNNLVITVPGSDGQQAKSLATTAKLYIRPVVGQPLPVGPDGKVQTGGEPAPGAEQPGTPPANPPAPAPGAGQQAPAPGASPGTESKPSNESGTASGTASSGETSGTGESSGTTAQNRVFPAPAQAPTTPAPAPSPEPGAPNPALTPQQQAKQEIDAARALRQSTDPQVQQLAAQQLDCHKPDPLAGNDDPKLPLVTCSSDGNAVYLLAPMRIDGQDIKDASSSLNQQSQWAVDLTFKNADAWADLTKEYLQKQVAFTLDSKVISAPVVQQGPQLGGTTQITGQFNASTAKELANSLKYGSLPLSFEVSEASTVSATLGLASLHAGLIAGAIGLVAVLLYCLLYYRMLGFLAGFSLVASGVAVYGIIVLLGRWINFTLDLAGIAGLIIGIGMTADSFVVFFERIKDEMREGRSFRSAVPRGWARAQRTNLSGKTVSLIASVVLYILAAGQVKGFAFTLGLTTVLDVVVLYLVTSPLMMLASRSPFWAKPSVNGLGAVQQIARERKAAGTLVGTGSR
ncbi:MULTISPECIES: protein translocase subunit SecD [Nocardia]|uniref:Protein translocase subunit SecD n=1 Tax=Nocardia nova TaxID=37330 RepID=A0A2S6ABD0_9NOCA|nr:MULTISPECIES: protein translocase subunit SecD [Nocardia]OBF67277.1 protein-export membrane protein SecD [Mycobacterium sp. 852002-51759_SCH5129042]MBF6275139.1 protein translocase subunit SecD [Nocardia nova]MBV7706299.1 protein translocase subunit SecD [Nocardia nova]OBA54986.1 protein-export membrane protein SecD [Nocardia sp. 852002-51101_SCH5132738]OBB49408.1 protein-export membrane protein SecD [Nocardia sp. 852002-51244_SCH5132740]